MFDQWDPDSVPIGWEAYLGETAPTLEGEGEPVNTVPTVSLKAPMGDDAHVG